MSSKSRAWEDLILVKNQMFQKRRINLGQLFNLIVFKVCNLQKLEWLLWSCKEINIIDFILSRCKSHNMGKLRYLAYFFKLILVQVNAS